MLRIQLRRRDSGIVPIGCPSIAEICQPCLRPARQVAESSSTRKSFHVVPCTPPRGSEDSSGLNPNPPPALRLNRMLDSVHVVVVDGEMMGPSPCRSSAGRDTEGSRRCNDLTVSSNVSCVQSPEKLPRLYLLPLYHTYPLRTISRIARRIARLRKTCCLWVSALLYCLSSS